MDSERDKKKDKKDKEKKKDKDKKKERNKEKSVFDAKIIIDPSTKISKGYGFVKFHDKAESERAINEMNGQIIEGKAMKTGSASYKKNEQQNEDNMLDNENGANINEMNNNNENGNGNNINSEEQRQEEENEFIKREKLKHQV